MWKVTAINDGIIDSVVRELDSVRAKFLRQIWKIQFLRLIYANSSSRLSFGLLLTTLLYLPLSFIRPDFLLVSGPIIWGYPHLIASYRFIQSTSQSRRFQIFCIMTGVAILAHLTDFGFQKLPFGVWQIIVATLCLFLTSLMCREFNFRVFLLGGLICYGLVRLAWWEPIIYVGGILILHNWVAFFYWIIAANTRPRRTVAIISTLMFLLLHYLVISGRMDHFFPMQAGEVAFPGSTEITGWYLASWANDTLTWYRFLVVYAFGLSVHYYVWLKAIPESVSKFEHPNCFRVSLNKLKEDIGANASKISIIAILAGMALWLFSLPIGIKFYFEIALLHGSLEMMFLISPLARLFSKKS